jgi:hypothetical protein
MFEDGEHGRDGNDKARGSQQGCQSRRWFTYREGCARSRLIARHGFRLGDAVCA